jgi:hypothetical protein
MIDTNLILFRKCWLTSYQIENILQLEKEKDQKKDNTYCYTFSEEMKKFKTIMKNDYFWSVLSKSYVNREINERVFFNIVLGEIESERNRIKNIYVKNLPKTGKLFE